MQNLSMVSAGGGGGPTPLTLPIGAPVDGVFYLGFGVFFIGPYGTANLTSSHVSTIKTVFASMLSVNAANMLVLAANMQTIGPLLGFTAPPSPPSNAGGRHLMHDDSGALFGHGRQLLQNTNNIIPTFVMYINITSTGSTATAALLTAFNSLRATWPQGGPTALANAVESGIPGATALGIGGARVSLQVAGGSVYSAPPSVDAPVTSPSPSPTSSPSPSPSPTSSPSPSPSPTASPSPSPAGSVPSSPPVNIPTAGAVPVDYVQPYTTPAAQQAALSNIDLSSLSPAAAATALLDAAYSLNDPNSPLNSNATAATALRDNLLDKLTTSVNLSSVGAAALTSLATSVSSLVGNPDQISAAGAASALSLLSQITTVGSSSGAPLSSSTGTAVALGLSSIVSAATSSSSAAVPASALTTVFNVVNSLSTSLVTGVAAGAPPVEIVSAAIQMRVQVDVPSPDSRLFTAPLTAPGSASAFDPLPTGIFADPSAGVRTQFLSLTFDPYFDPNTSGVTRLAFSTTSGTEVPVNGLSKPIKFTLKAPTGLADGTKAVCQYYDTTAKAYSTVGCVGIPQPQPPGHVLDWVDGYTVTSDAEMAKAWNITGPLMQNCAAQILDCSLDDPGTIMPNPARPFDFPGVSCNKNLSTAPMLVLVGSQCKMIQPTNNVSCAWDNVKQAFTGAGCVATGGPVECACRHVRILCSP